ncbi:efflux RND transporter periplasmic adaptor subunit [Hwanghaeella grinnelliae]|uniref:Efflux RND transporter periplasmic adaptor subunit n=1 Tax=Hwanghaeella grinnelliae TaxID=2500179 RepID=A0A3S2Z7Z2_9PROT|nr:efflux RND transporter periplasmic adaptor subunit [Hwanghaeella grinnelliae]RVU35825.1 efflux RND transporter periplasmic adaptor subunit [Hwanghaeella grinnelliae]
MRNSFKPLTVLAIAVSFFAFAANSSAQAQGQQGEKPPQAVTVVTLKSQDVTLTSRLPGRVVASGVAEVRPQVNGIIVERLFEEGSKVKSGDPLYLIDPATYEAQVAAAKAQVAAASATLKASSKDAKRAEELINRGTVSEQRLEEAVAQRDSDAAALQVARAELQAAEIDLDRTTIRARLSGSIGRSFTSRGALVTAAQTEPMAVIRTLDPVHVDVTQSAAEILAWRKGTMQGRFTGLDTSVSLILADGETFERKGEVTAAEPYVNETTGVVTLRMTFDNPNDLLLPGMYVQVEMPQGKIQNAVLAPQQGVQRNRQGEPFAYVVGEGNVVEQRNLTIVQASGSSWVVSAGLQEGDRLIIEGLQKIAPGATVAPEEAPEEVAARSAAE